MTSQTARRMPHRFERHAALNSWAASDSRAGSETHHDSSLPKRDLAYGNVRIEDWRSWLLIPLRSVYVRGIRWHRPGPPSPTGNSPPGERELDALRQPELNRNAAASRDGIRGRDSGRVLLSWMATGE